MLFRSCSINCGPIKLNSEPSIEHRKISVCWGLALDEFDVKSEYVQGKICLIVDIILRTPEIFSQAKYSFVFVLLKKKKSEELGEKWSSIASERFSESPNGWGSSQSEAENDCFRNPKVSVET